MVTPRYFSHLVLHIHRCILLAHFWIASAELVSCTASGGVDRMYSPTLHDCNCMHAYTCTFPWVVLPVALITPPGWSSPMSATVPCLSTFHMNWPWFLCERCGPYVGLCPEIGWVALHTKCGCCRPGCAPTPWHVTLQLISQGPLRVCFHFGHICTVGSGLVRAVGARLMIAFHLWAWMLRIHAASMGVHVANNQYLLHCHCGRPRTPVALATHSHACSAHQLVAVTHNLQYWHCRSYQGAGQGV